MFSSSLYILLLGAANVIAQQSPVVVCVAGQCLQGYSNITLGTKLSTPGAPATLLLLPGQYTSTTSPQLLHEMLTSSSSSLTPSPGFENSSKSLSLPLNVALEPGIAAFPLKMYSGQASFASLPTTPSGNSSSPLPGNSFALAANVWASISSGSNRIVLWDSVPDLAQLPAPASSSNAISLLDVQSSLCSPPCSGSGVCSASGTCVCPTGFTGSACEACASGFFGPSCSPCPQGCTACDEGLGGSGQCLKPVVANPPSSCNCLNGVCGSGGRCSCNEGWVNDDSGLACAKCAPGFFRTSAGDCQVCQIGCSQCADTSGTCLACQPGFTQDANDRTRCNPPTSATNTGTICPEGSFGNGGSCTACSSVCRTCTGPTSNDCVVCGTGRFSRGGQCVTADADGVCEGTSLIADNVKRQCDTCGAKCTSCRIPNFGVGSTVNQLQCTRCLPGFVISQGKCVESCPSGTFLSSDNVNCAPCDSTCGSCAGSATFCLSCRGGQLASGGRCVASCPSSSFTSSGGATCTSCHPDCATCSGSSFSQCLSCNPERPVLSGGRCLPTCARNQFFDRASSSCQACDGSCASCSGTGASNCLSCSNPRQVVKGGACVQSECETVPGLGACLTDLISVPSSTNGNPPLPTISGIDSPTRVQRLQWWQILLMALGCAFIFLVILLVWRRHARKQRAKQTALFASSKDLDKKGWRNRLLRLGERLFGQGRSRHVPTRGAAAPGATLSTGAPSISPSDDLKLMMLREQEEERHQREMEKIFAAYDPSRAGTSVAPSVFDNDRRSEFSDPSMYSQVTGQPRRAPEPRLPVRKSMTETSRYSMSSFFGPKSVTREVRRVTPPPITEAEIYAESNRETDAKSAMSTTLSTFDWVVEGEQQAMGTKNPFRK